jgi:hypothetical protein
MGGRRDPIERLRRAGMSRPLAFGHVLGLGAGGRVFALNLWGATVLCLTVAARLANRALM